MLAGLDAVHRKGLRVDFTESMETPLKRESSARIAIKGKKKIVFIETADIIAVEARGNYVVLHHTSSSHILRQSISKIAEKLKPFGFVRIHRSFIVNSAFAEDLQPLPTGEYVLRVGGGKKYMVTRTYKDNLRFLAASWIGLDLMCDA